MGGKRCRFAAATTAAVTAATTRPLESADETRNVLPGKRKTPPGKPDGVL